MTVRSAHAHAIDAVSPSGSPPFEERYRINMPRIYRYLLAQVGTAEDAADLTQTVFLRAFQSLHRFRGDETAFPAWLFRIARNAATDAHRRRKPTTSWEALAFAPSIDQQFEIDATRDERLDRLRTLVANLTPDQRELLSLRFAGELTTRQIAALLGRSEDAVKKQLSRTIHSLKEHYRHERMDH